ncbi:hypothetical protein FZEAL_633 [Fusarium zealandicum]|uniref:Sporulation-specific protein Sps2p n=1 Tax=Fusarium zealandicum TaxID=1053134 RepID=A0A8H4UUZ3_9HYPO|nr:hypothetical protein FZEAL_633 [Fusarium zealandicum]
MAPTSRIAFAAVSILLSGHLAAADCDISSNYTSIESPDSVDAISSCTDIDGSLSLLLDSDPSSWPSDKASVDLGDVTSLTGDLVIYPHYRPKKTVVKGADLKTIEGAFTLQNTGSSKASTIQDFDLSFPALEEIGDNYVIYGAFAKLSIEHEKDIEVGSMMRVYHTEVQQLKLNGVHTVKGDFSIDSNRYMEELEAGALKTINKALSIKGNSALEKVSFPKLKNVNGDMEFNANGALKRISLPALEFAGTIAITSNGDAPTVLFPWLSSLGNSNTTATSTFEDVAKIEFASLKDVKGALAFQFTNLKDLTIPLLKELDGAINVEDNPSLTTLALPRTTYIKEMVVSGNDELTNVTANALKSAGSISLKGSFTNVEFFGLEKVSGDFKVSGDDSMDCSWFDENIKKIVEGKYTCVGDHDEKEKKPSTGGIEDTEGNPEDYITSDDDNDDDDSTSDKGGGSRSGSASAESDSEEGGSGSKGLSSGAKAGIGIGVTIGVIAAAVVLFFLWRRRRLTNGPDQERVGSSGSGSTRASPFDGQHLGVQTKIEANNPSPSPSIGTLNFGRNSIIEATGGFSEKSLSAWKTIRRVSDSSGGSTTTRDGTSILKE